MYIAIRMKHLKKKYIWDMGRGKSYACCDDRSTAYGFMKKVVDVNKSTNK